MTRLLYYENADQLHFSARVIATRHQEYRLQVELDQTAFYVEGGGQPSDTGDLSGARVIRVFEEEGHVWHELEKPVSMNEQVEGHVDPVRRKDMSAQHTGQHILSSAFMRLFAAETSSFHLTDNKVSIDLSRGDLTEEQILQAEALSNEELRKAWPVEIQVFNGRDQLPENLRKIPIVNGAIRLVRISDFDLCPCGGTHISNTAELGLIKVVGFERARGKTRVEFMCGDRAISEFEARLASDRIVSQTLSVPFVEHVGAMERVLENEKELSRELSRLNKDLLEQRALLQAPTVVLDNRAYYRIEGWSGTLDDAKLYLALLLKKEPGVGLVVLSGDPARIVVASSCAVNASVVLKNVVTTYSGKGGGTPQAAQGGLPLASLDAAIAALEEALLA